MAVELKKGQKVNLSKFANSGEILFNLNWTQGLAKKGLFGINKSQSIDLGLGAFVEMKDGTKHVIQALGNNFGNLDSAPYVKLDGDDRTGAVNAGENLRVNGRMIDNIKRILVYTFIYEGVTNWKEAYATVTIKQTGGDDFIIHMDEFSVKQKMFAISEIVNIGDAMSVEKKALFFHGHQDMDKAFNWGFKWTTGRK